MGEHRAHLWALCYRLTGDAAEADDLVQDTFERALSRPPADRDRPWRPWLTRVATNLALDLLRRRRHRAYTGPWLPAPVPSEDLGGLEVASTDDVELRYGQLESATIAFLLALECLEPLPRVVLVLADVVGHTGPEIASMLTLTAANTRQILSRARAALRPYADARCRPSVELAAASRQALQGFFAALAAGDTSAMARHLSDDAICINDGGGEFQSALKVVRGAAKVIKLQVGVAAMSPPPEHFELVEVNNLPALFITLPEAGRGPRQASRVLIRVELDQAADRIVALQIVLATSKLHALRFWYPPGDAQAGTEAEPLPNP